MATIGNDHELKTTLDGLDATQQRVLGGMFVQKVMELCDDPRVRRAVEVAVDPEATPAALDDAFRSAKAVSVKTYTDCGKDTDWMSQAAHFVAAAATAALAPAAQQGKDNPAWKAAMQARMARNCEMIEHQDGGPHNEAEVQYELAAGFPGA
jgi:hypothetical protein